MEESESAKVNGCLPSQHIQESRNAVSALDRRIDEQGEMGSKEVPGDSFAEERSARNVEEEEKPNEDKIPVGISRKSRSAETSGATTDGFPIRSPIFPRRKITSSISNRVRTPETHACQKSPRPQCLSHMSKEEILKFWIGDSVIKEYPGSKVCNKHRRMRKKKKKKKQLDVNRLKRKASNSSDDGTREEKPSVVKCRIPGSRKRLLASGTNGSLQKTKRKWLLENAKKRRSVSLVKSRESISSGSQSSPSLNPALALTESPITKSLDEIKVQHLQKSGRCAVVYTSTKAKLDLRETGRLHSETDLTKCFETSRSSVNNRKAPRSCPVLTGRFRNLDQKCGICINGDDKVKWCNDVKQMKNGVLVRVNSTDNLKPFEDKNTTSEEFLREKDVVIQNPPIFPDIHVMQREESELSYCTAEMSLGSASSDVSFVSSKTGSAVTENRIRSEILAVPVSGRRNRRCHSMNEEKLESFGREQFTKSLQEELSFSDDSYFLKSCSRQSVRSESGMVPEACSLNESDIIFALEGSSLDLLCRETLLHFRAEKFSRSNSSSSYISIDNISFSEISIPYGRFSSSDEEIEHFTFFDEFQDSTENLTYGGDYHSSEEVKYVKQEDSPEKKSNASLLLFANAVVPGDIETSQDKPSCLKYESFKETEPSDISLDQIDENVCCFDAHEQDRQGANTFVALKHTDKFFDTLIEDKQSADALKNERYSSNVFQTETVRPLHDSGSSVSSNSVRPVLPNEGNELKILNLDKEQFKSLSEENLCLSYFDEQAIIDKECDTKGLECKASSQETSRGEIRHSDSFESTWKRTDSSAEDSVLRNLVVSSAEIFQCGASLGNAAVPVWGSRNFDSARTFGSSCDSNTQAYSNDLTVDELHESSIRNLPGLRNSEPEVLNDDGNSDLHQAESNASLPVRTSAHQELISSDTLDSHLNPNRKFAQRNIHDLRNSYSLSNEDHTVSKRKEGVVSISEPCYEATTDSFLQKPSAAPNPFSGRPGRNSSSIACAPVKSDSFISIRYFKDSPVTGCSISTDLHSPEITYECTHPKFFLQNSVSQAVVSECASRAIESLSTQYCSEGAVTNDRAIITSEREREHGDMVGLSAQNPLASNSTSTQSSVSSKRMTEPERSPKSMVGLSTQYCPEGAAADDYAFITWENEHEYEDINDLLAQISCAPDSPCSQQANGSEQRGTSPFVLRSFAVKDFPEYEDVFNFKLTGDTLDDEAMRSKSTAEADGSRGRKGISSFRWKRSRLNKRVIKARCLFMCCCCPPSNSKN